MSMEKLRTSWSATLGSRPSASAKARVTNPGDMKSMVDSQSVRSRIVKSSSLGVGRSRAMIGANEAGTWISPKRVVIVTVSGAGTAALGDGVPRFAPFFLDPRAPRRGFLFFAIPVLCP